VNFNDVNIFAEDEESIVETEKSEFVSIKTKQEPFALPNEGIKRRVTTLFAIYCFFNSS